MIPGIIAGSFPPAGGAATFTEVYWEWNNGSGSAGWNTDYDISSSGAPANSVALIWVMNGESSPKNMGVRSTSSAAARYFDVYSSGAGIGGYSMHVNVDGSQQIDYYAEGVSTSEKFAVIGYWEDATYTEDYSTIGTTNNSWVTETASNLVANSVAEVIMCSNGHNQNFVGAGSAAGTPDFYEDCDDTGASGNLPTNFPCELDGSKQFKWRHERKSTEGGDSRIVGGLETGRTWTEYGSAGTYFTPSASSGAWYSETLVPTIPEGAIAVITGSNAAGSRKPIMGVRKVGSALEKKQIINEPERASKVAKTSTHYVEVDSSNNIEIYGGWSGLTSTTTNIRYYLMGWWE